jgi:hypothetical protein
MDKQAEKINKKKEVSKKAKWTILGDLLTVTMPSGKSAQFDMQKLDTRATKYYGTKQWLQDGQAGVEGDDEKIAGMIANYKEAVEKGLEITETGKIGIKGKVRVNAKVSMTESLKQKIMALPEKEQKPAIESLKKLGIEIVL